MPPPDRAPPSKGAHLVLEMQAEAASNQIHNPSGHEVAKQEYVRLPPDAFDRFFAGRGVAVRG